MTREEAIALYKSKFWETMSPEDIVMFQMFEPEMCMPSAVYRKAVKEALKRDVQLHELGKLNRKKLEKEFLKEKKILSPEERLDLMPKVHREKLAEAFPSFKKEKKGE